MNLFTETSHCRSRAKCHLCRDPGKRGEQFRNVLAAYHEMPGAGFFVCPFGVTEETATHPPAAEPAIIHPVPRKDWPAWAHLIADDAGDDDKGIGDTVERRIGKTESAAFKAWYHKLFGKMCGCERRRGEWNAMYPYNPPA